MVWAQDGHSKVFLPITKVGNELIESYFPTAKSREIGLSRFQFNLDARVGRPASTTRKRNLQFRVVYSLIARFLFFVENRMLPNHR